MKWFNRLLIILLAFLILAGVLMRSQVEGQKQDVRALTERIEVLEQVIYDTQIKPSEKEKAEREYSAFRL